MPREVRVNKKLDHPGRVIYGDKAYANEGQSGLFQTSTRPK